MLTILNRGLREGGRPDLPVPFVGSSPPQFGFCFVLRIVLARFCRFQLEMESTRSRRREAGLLSRFR